MRIALIGMSGSGKSTWSIKLARAGFRRFCCDELIAEILSAELERPGQTPMELGDWMGFPYDPAYEIRESKYLAAEISVMGDILAHLEDLGSGRDTDIVVDTTGSVIYTGREILRKLRQSTTIVYLSTPSEVRTRMLDAYLANHRPVLWHGVFARAPGESRKDAMARCYPILMETRQRLYRQFADVVIDHYTLNRDGFGLKDLLTMVAADRKKRPVDP